MLVPLTWALQCRSHAPASLNDDACVMQDLQRPLYMQAKDAIEYGIVDRIVKPEVELYGEIKAPQQWDKEAGLVEQPAPGSSSGW